MVKLPLPCEGGVQHRRMPIPAGKKQIDSIRSNSGYPTFLWEYVWTTNSFNHDFLTNGVRTQVGQIDREIFAYICCIRISNLYIYIHISDIDQI